jgi:hypothetical protein
MARPALLRALLSIWVGVSVALLTLPLSPRVVRADPEPEVSDPEPEVSDSSPYDRMLGVELIGGLDTPYGLIGADFRLSPIQWLTFDVGGGVSRDGFRLGGGVGVVIPQDHFAFTIRLGAAAGPLNWDSGGLQAQHRYWSVAAFINADIGLEYRWDEGFYGRVMVGVEDDVIDTADSCTFIDGGGPCDPSLGSHPTRLYVGLAVGYMFDITR